MSELASWKDGEGPPVLLIHGTGTSSRFFDPVRGELERLGTVTAVDRPGWGSSPAPEDYRRTSIAEQAIRIAGVADSPTSVVGIGLGAVVALELAISRPETFDRVVAIEPTVLGLLPSATAGVSADSGLIRETVERGGAGEAYELFLGGGLPTLGAGASRLGPLADRSPSAALAFLVELPAVPAWPLDPVRLDGLDGRVLLATVPDSPDLLREAADSLLPRIPGAGRSELPEGGPGAVAAAFRWIRERST